MVQTIPHYNVYMIIQSYGIKSFLVDRARRDINRNRDELRRVEGDIRKEENQRLRLKDDLASAKRHLDKVLQEIRSLEMSSRNYQDFGRKHFTNIYGLTQTEFFSELLCDMDGCGAVKWWALYGRGRLRCRYLRTDLMDWVEVLSELNFDERLLVVFITKSSAYYYSPHFGSG